MIELTDCQIYQYYFEEDSSSFCCMYTGFCSAVIYYNIDLHSSLVSVVCLCICISDYVYNAVDIFSCMYVWVCDRWPTARVDALFTLAFNMRDMVQSSTPHSGLSGTRYWVTCLHTVASVTMQYNLSVAVKLLD